jgi:hypothetical protein
VVTVLRGPHRGLAGYAITGFFELVEAALVECALTSCPVSKGLPTFGAPHRRAAHDPIPTFRGGGVYPRRGDLTLARSGRGDGFGIPLLQNRQARCRPEKV